MHKDMTLEPEQTLWIFQTHDTPCPRCIWMQSPTAAWQPAAKLLQYAVCLGARMGGGVRDGGGGVVGYWVEASVGSGSNLLKDVRRTKQRRCSAVSALGASLFLSKSTLSQGQQPTPWGSDLLIQGTLCMHEVLSLYYVGALSSSKQSYGWITSDPPRRKLSL